MVRAREGIWGEFYGVSYSRVAIRRRKIYFENERTFMNIVESEVFSKTQTWCWGIRSIRGGNGSAQWAFAMRMGQRDGRPVTLVRVSRFVTYVTMSWTPYGCSGTHEKRQFAIKTLINLRHLSKALI